MGARHSLAPPSHLQGTVLGLRSLIAAALVALPFVSPAPPAPRALDVRYTFSVARDSTNARVVNVTASFTGDASGTTRLAHPTSWAGEDSLQHAILGLQVLPPARLLADSNGAYVV